MNEVKWVTYIRRSHSRHSREILMTRKATEIFPYPSRPATAEEIATEIERRSQQRAEIKAQQEFSDRQDVQDARAIAGYIEHKLALIVDALTPEEWAQLRTRIQVHYVRDDTIKG